ncbi:MAG TPA: hypothetical protein VL424_11660, partial [Pararobbsia sp.]|nr:hypothetical protein [Pararobbsia sp.]
MSLLTSINTWSRRRWSDTAAPEADIDDERQTIVHVTLDAGHAALLRQALSRDCTGDEWTMRIASMRDSDRVRLSLYVPKQKVHQAVSHIERHVPSAKVDQIVEIPEALTDAWRDLAHLEADKTKARWRSVQR